MSSTCVTGKSGQYPGAQAWAMYKKIEQSSGKSEQEHYFVLISVGVSSSRGREQVLQLRTRRITSAVPVQNMKLNTDFLGI